jgi:tetratricopeptide (TPR) repeat protein
MSVINKMLHDLDRRQAPGAGTDANAVRAPSTESGGHEWFWRILVVLLAAALGWMGWVAIQLMPRKPLVTELAFQAAAEAHSRAQEKKPEEKLAETPAATPAPASGSLRLALQLETVPVRAKTVEPERPAAPRPAVAEKADAHFRRAALFHKHARMSEAESELMAALRIDPSHAEARQVLAQIYVRKREYSAALEVIDRAGPVTGHAELQAMRGLVLQRLGRHGEAVEVYQEAVRSAEQPATTWIGLGISLEGLGRRSEAVLAYRRALTAGQLTAEAREYAVSRVRVLE